MKCYPGPPGCSIVVCICGGRCREWVSLSCSSCRGREGEQVGIGVVVSGVVTIDVIVVGVAILSSVVVHILNVVFVIVVVVLIIDVIVRLPYVV